MRSQVFQRGLHRPTRCYPPPDEQEHAIDQWQKRRIVAEGQRRWSVNYYQIIESPRLIEKVSHLPRTKQAVWVRMALVSEQHIKVTPSTVVLDRRHEVRNLAGKNLDEAGAL